jgi:hypothetical protein
MNLLNNLGWGERKVWLTDSRLQDIKNITGRCSGHKTARPVNFNVIQQEEIINEAIL